MSAWVAVPKRQYPTVILSGRNTWLNTRYHAFARGRRCLRKREVASLVPISQGFNLTLFVTLPGLDLQPI